MIREFRTGAQRVRAGLRGEWGLLAICALLIGAGATVTAHMCNAMSGGMPMPGGWTLSMVWMLSAGQSWPGAAASFVAAWIAMMVAMMLPSLVPALARYRREVLSANVTGSAGLTALVGIGYFATWAVAGAAVYPLGVGVVIAELRWPMLARSAPIAIVIILLLAAWAQFSGWKSRQLRRCRDGSRCGQTRQFDARNALQHGARSGVHCALCCANVMIVLVVVGVMDLRAMAAATLAITVERLALIPRRPVSAAARLTTRYIHVAARASICQLLRRRSPLGFR